MITAHFFTIKEAILDDEINCNMLIYKNIHKQ